MRRVRWGSLLVVILMLLAISAAVLEQQTVALTLALCSIAWAILSLKERP